ncbi:MAG: phasin family protein [Pseudomonadota bacterium]
MSGLDFKIARGEAMGMKTGGGGTLTTNKSTNDSKGSATTKPIRKKTETKSKPNSKTSAKKSVTAMSKSSKESALSSNASAFKAKIKASAREIWLAGLGAVEKAEVEGKSWFQALVKDGTRMDLMSKDHWEKQFAQVKDQVRGAAKDKVDEVKGFANDSFGKLEKNFDEQVANVLQRLKIPTQTEVTQLKKRIKKLEESLEGKTESKTK